MTRDLAPNDLMALRAYAQGRRADLKATELGAARRKLSAAGLVKNCTSPKTSPMLVAITPAGRRLLADLDRRTLAPMSPAATDWVYREVLTGTYRAACTVDTDPRLIRACACQGGSCGHCAAGRHELCRTHRHGPVVGPETYVVARTGGALTPVWLAGKACAWRCSCGCPPPEPALTVAAPEPVFEQLDLFALAGAS